MWVTIAIPPPPQPHAPLPPCAAALQGEYLVANDPEWLRRLLAAYNAAYAWGVQVMLSLLSVLCMIVAPFLGFGGALWAFGWGLMRTLVTAYGRDLADMLGYGEFVRTWATHTAWRRRQRPSAVRLPASGVKGSSRFPALKEAEFGLADAPSCLATPIRVFNLLYAHGFAAGVVTMAVLTFIVSPFLGMAAALAHFMHALSRVLFSQVSGRILLEALGVAELMDQQTALMMEEMGVTSVHGNGGVGEGPACCPDGSAGGAGGAPRPGEAVPFVAVGPTGVVAVPGMTVFPASAGLPHGAVVMGGGGGGGSVAVSVGGDGMGGGADPMPPHPAGPVVYGGGVGALYGATAPLAGMYPPPASSGWSAAGTGK